MKHLFIICLLCTAGGLYAQNTMFVGAGLEANANTREGAAMGVSVASAVDLNLFKQLFSAGLKLGFSLNMDTISTLETSALFRYYLPLPISGFFVQADLGGAFFFEGDRSFPAFLGGLTAGWRYDVGNTWYIEPFARGGYPFIWGVGIQAGISLDLKWGKR
jgi:hypothetical protein